jgi:hypothetical protein
MWKQIIFPCGKMRYWKKTVYIAIKTNALIKEEETYCATSKTFGDENAKGACILPCSNQWFKGM